MIPKRKFSDLLRTVGSIPGLDRLRFVTSHPRYMSLGVVDAVAETPAACENFHIPFQSGSNEILSSMGRGHTREKYLHIVDRIRSVSFIFTPQEGTFRVSSQPIIFVPLYRGFPTRPSRQMSLLAFLGKQKSSSWRL